MKDIISDNVLVSFTTVYDSKSPEIVDRIGETAKSMLTDDVWLKSHVEHIVDKTTAFEKGNMQALVNAVVHSTTTRRIIKGYSRTTCNMYVASATKDFSNIISEEDEAEKERRVKITKAVHNHQFAEAVKRATAEEEEIELDEEAEKENEKLKLTQDILLYKNIRKFEVQDIAHIPKTTALTENQAIDIY